MKTYQVRGYVDIRTPVCCTVEAEDEEEARIEAEARFPGLDDLEEIGEVDVVEFQVEEVEELP